jgi:hypothetical protein
MATASHLGDNYRFGQALATFAETYADRNERNYAPLKQAADSGIVTADAS